MPPMGAEEFIGLGRSHQPCQPLNACRFKIKIICMRRTQPGGIQFIKLTQTSLLHRLAVHKSCHATEVMILEPLAGVCRQSGHFGHTPDAFQRFGTLLQIIVIDSRHQVELRTGIFQPLAPTPFGKERIVLGNAVQAAQGTDAIVIKLLVHGRTLIDPHQADIGHQQLQLVLRLVADGQIQLFCLLVIHLHEGMKSQIVASFGFARPIEANTLRRLLCRLVQRIKVLVTKAICNLVQRVYPMHFCTRSHACTRSHYPTHH